MFFIKQELPVAMDFLAASVVKIGENTCTDVSGSPTVLHI
jgi:hypothetical protein